MQSFDEVLRNANDALLAHRFDEACDWLEAAAALQSLDKNWAGILAILREAQGR